MRSDVEPWVPRATMRRGRASGPASRVVILGMHRSGTSALAELLIANGLRGGTQTDLMPSTKWNPHGHFENRLFVDVNEWMLRELASTWWAPPSEEAVRASALELAVVAQQTLRKAAESYGSGVMLLKDPRFAVLTPVWTKVFDARTLYVLPIRDPGSSARSLMARDGMELPFGCALWEAYMVSALRGLRGALVTIVDAEAIVTDPTARRDFVNGVRHVCQLGTGHVVDHVVDPSLLGPALRDPELEQLLTSSQLDLYRDLLRRCGTTAVMPSVSLDVSLASRALLDRNLRRQREAATAEQADTDLGQELRRVRSELEQTRAELALAREEAAVLRARLAIPSVTS